MSVDFAVIFDVDGVLIDSYDAHFESWKRLTAEYGREYTEAEFVAGFGRTSREVIREQWPEEFQSEEAVRDLALRKEIYYREIVEADFPAMPGAQELIEALAAAGVPIAVGSSGPPPNVDLVVRKLGAESFIRAKITGDDVTRGKPNPQVFLLAAERIGMAPSRCVVLEDAPVGVAAARAAGMKVVGVVSTGRTEADVRGADLIVRAPAELSPEKLASLFEEPSK